MPTPFSAWIPVHMSYTGTTTATVYATPGIAGTVKQITVGVPVVMTTGTIAPFKAGSVALATALSAATDGVAAGVAENMVLATVGQTLKIAATDVLSVTWTVTSAGSFVGGGCTIWIEPNTW